MAWGAADCAGAGCVSSQWGGGPRRRELEEPLAPCESRTPATWYRVSALLVVKGLDNSGMVQDSWPRHGQDSRHMEHFLPCPALPAHTQVEADESDEEEQEQQQEAGGAAADPNAISLGGGIDSEDDDGEGEDGAGGQRKREQRKKSKKDRNREVRGCGSPGGTGGYRVMGRMQSGLGVRVNSPGASGRGVA